VNTHIQSLKIWLKSILPWLKYSIFSRGLFFYWCTLQIAYILHHIDGYRYLCQNWLRHTTYNSSSTTLYLIKLLPVKSNVVEKYEFKKMLSQQKYKHNDILHNYTVTKYETWPT